MGGPGRAGVTRGGGLWVSAVPGGPTCSWGGGGSGSTGVPGRGGGQWGARLGTLGGLACTGKG